MKILQLVTKRQYRGAEVFAANLSLELINFGHQVIFAGLYKNESDILNVDGARNIDLVEKKSGILSGNLVKAILELLRTEKPDVVQCNGSDTLKYMVAASFFTRNVSITYRNISTISEWIDNPLKLFTYRLLFKKVDHVTSVGSKSIHDLINTLNYPKEQTSVIRRGIPIKSVTSPAFEKSLRKELNLNQEDKIVMHIGNFSPEKNHIFLLDLFSDIKHEHPEVKLVCVGNGVTFQLIKEELKKRKLEETVFLLGFRRDIPELLVQANCFTLVSKIEGVPGVILEAASQKIPSVATNVGGVPEVLYNGKTGFIIESFNKVEFKKRLISLVKDEDLNKKMGENAFQLIKDEFDPVKNARKFESLYARLSGKSLGNKRKLRILHIIQKKQFRGAEVFASQLATHFQDSGHHVKIVSIYNGSARLPFNGGIISLNRSKLSRTFDPNGWRKLSEIIKTFQPDIIQANASDTLKYAVMSKIFFRWKVPLVYRNASTPSFYIKNKSTRRFNAFLLEQVDLIISVSQASLKDLNTIFPFTKIKSMVIPVGIEDNPISESQDFPYQDFPYKEKAVHNLIHIGSFTREKNHIGLLMIFQKILAKENNCILNLIGGGPLLPDFQRKVKELGLEQKICFLGEIESPTAYLKAGDALLLPSLVEGLPGVILEAMYNKTPVIAYDVGGVSEVVINNITGKLVSFNDEEAFSDAVINLFEDKLLQKKIVDKAYFQVMSQYKNKEIQSRFLEAYRSLI